MTVLLPAETVKKEIVDLTRSPSASPPLVKCKDLKLPVQTNSVLNHSQNNLLGDGISNMSFSVAQQTFNISLHSHPIETLKPRWRVERSDGGGLGVKNSIHNGRSLFGSTRVDLFADGNVNVPVRWELPQLQVDSYRQPSSITEPKHQVLSQMLAPSERCLLASEEFQKEPMATAPIRKMTEGAPKPIVIKSLESKEAKRCNQVETKCRTELAKTEVTKTTGSVSCIACKWGFRICDLGKPCSECVIGWDRTGIKWNCTYDPNFVRPAGPPPDIYKRNDCADTATKKQKSGSGTRNKLRTLASPTPHSQPIKTSQSKSDLPEAHWQTIRKMEYKRLKEILIYILVNELNFKSVDFLTSIPDDGLGCKVNYLSVEFSFTHGYAITAPKEFKRMFETPMMRWNRKNWALVPVLLKKRLITVRRLEDPAPKKAPRFIESDWSKKMKRLKGNDGWWNELGVQESFNYRCTGFKSASSTGTLGETSGVSLSSPTRSAF